MRNLKAVISLLLCAVFLSTTVLTSCGNNDKGSDDSLKTTQSNVKESSTALETTEATQITEISSETKAPAEYTITYILYGGTEETPNPSKYTSDDEIALNAPVKKGYTFAGWTYDGQSVPQKTLVISKGSTGDKVYSANWTANTYTVTFNSNGGASIESIEIAYDELYKLPEASWEGHRFAGWFDGNKHYTDSVWKETANVTLTAKWDTLIYNIYYELDGGTHTNANAYTYDDEVALKAPTKVGYDFAGWTYAGQSEPVMNVTIPVGSTGHKTYTANWTPSTYTVKLDSAGGEKLDDYTVTYNEYYELPIPKWEGHTFVGWFNGNIGYTSGKWLQTSGIELVAKWDIISYDITYELLGGSHTNGNTYTYDDEIILQAPTKTGYDFLGWTYEGQTEPQKSVIIPAGNTGDKHFVANWAPSSYTLAFNTAGGPAVDDMTVTYNAEYELPIPEWEGHIFAGWFVGNQRYYSGTWIQTSGLTLTAKWNVVTYNIDYTLNGGTHSNANTYTYDDEIVLSEPQYDGHTFLGWTYDGQTEPQKSVIIPAGSTGNKSYTANWQANTYTITFDTNGGEPMAPMSVTYGEFCSLSSANRAGYVFGGWYDSDNVYYETVNRFTWLIPHDVTLKTDWNVYTYTVWCSTEEYGSSLDRTAYYYTVLDELTIQDPEKTGYTFLGWIWDGQTEPVKNFKLPVGSYGNYSLTATWQVNTYVISIDENGGDETDDVIAAYGEYYTMPTPTRKGYTFSGWYTEEGTAFAAHAKWESLESIAVRAEWSPTTNHLIVGLSHNGAGTLSGNTTGYYVYDTSVTVSVSDLTLGYTWLGWYSGDTLMSTDMEYTFTMGLYTTLTAMWCLNDHMEDFNFTSTVTTCTINGVVNNDITEVVIPECVTDISVAAFLDAALIESITVEEGNGRYTSVNDCLIDDGVLVLGCKNSVVPDDDSVTAIGENAFYSCVGLESVIIPASVTSIGKSAFYGCEKLTEVFFNAVECENVNSSYYPFCNAGTAGDGYRVVFGANVKRIPGYLFSTANSNDTKLIAIEFEEGSLCEYIGVWAFYGCSYVESITIPEKVTIIESYAFQMSNLREIYLNAECLEDSGDYSTARKPFGNSGMLGEGIRLVVGAGVQRIPSCYFQGTDNFNSVDYSKIVSVEFEEGSVCEYIGERAFQKNLDLQTVELPDGLNRVDQFAFAYCSEITEITIPESVTAVETCAFAACDSLADITILGELTDLGSGTFSNSSDMAVKVYFGSSACNDLDSSPFVFGGDLSVIIGAGVTRIPDNFFNTDTWTGNLVSLEFEEGSVCAEIGEKAFYKGAFTSVNLPDSVSTIGESAFAYTALTSITIPESVTAIDDYAFEYCAKLEGIYLKATSFTVGTYIFGSSGGEGEGIKLVVAANVTQIPSNTFRSYYADILKLTCVEFEEGSVCSFIGRYAFENCSMLENIIVPNSVTVIEQYAFYGCTGIESISVPFVGTYKDGSGSLYLESIFGFEVYSSLISVTVSDECAIADRAFADCAFIEKIVLGDKVSDIGDYVFSGCVSLKSIDVGSGVLGIGDYAFYECGSLAEILGGEGVESIGAYAFAYDSALETVVIPNSVTVIGDYAFSDCIALTEITISNGVTVIGEYAFYSCIALTEITIPDSVTSVGARAFWKCISLRKITTPSAFTNFESIMWSIPTVFESLTITTDVGAGLLKSCTGVENVILGDNVTAIGDLAFAWCSDLKSITFGKNLKTIGGAAFESCQALESVALPSTLEAIGESAFRSCKFTEIIIPDSVKTIGSYAFYYCTNLEKITFGKGLTSISERTFAGIGIKTLEIPDGIISIGEAAFADCFLLESVVMADSVQTLGIHVFHFDQKIKSITFGKSLTEIPEYTVYSPALESIVIPASVTKIDKLAFGGAGGDVLASIVVESGNTVYSSQGNCLIDKTTQTLIKGCKNSVIPTDGSVKAINDYAFAGILGITNIVIPDSVTSIGAYAFNGCTDLTSVELSSNITRIEDFTFYSTGIISVTIPDSVTYLGSWSFSSCNNLTEINIGKGLNTLGAYAFLNSPNLQSITVSSENQTFSSSNNCLLLGTRLILGSGGSEIPDGVTTIEPSAFRNLSNLESITIPDSVSTIYEQAFWGCTGITEVIIEGDFTSNGANIFSHCSSLTSVTLADGITTIGSGMFSGCTALEEIVIPNSVTDIGDSAFSGCTKLSHVTMSDSVTSIGEGAFRGCAIESVTIPSTVTFIGLRAFADCAALSEVFFNAVSCDDIEFGSGYVFENAGSAADGIKLVVGAGVTKIPADLFSVGFGHEANLISVEFVGESVCESIGESAFYGCSRLTSIVIPSSVTSIASSAFYGCYHLTEVCLSAELAESVVFIYAVNVYTYDSGASTRFTDDNGFIFCNNDEGYYLVGYEGSETSLILPESCNGSEYAVHKYAFYGRDDITSITIPAGVTDIGECAFRYCTRLEYITVAEGNAKYHSDGNCLIETESKTLLYGAKNSVIPADGSVAVIAEYAFYGIGITSVVIPESVTLIDTSAFSHCTELTSLTIASVNLKLENGAFYSSEKLTSFLILETAVEISISGNNAFGYVEKIYFCKEYLDDGFSFHYSIDNTDLLEAATYYYSETEPTLTAGIWWHYVDGVPTIW